MTMKTWTMVKGYRDENGTWQHRLLCDGEPVVTLRARHEDQQRQMDGEISMEEYYRRWPSAPA